jgi:extracellular factor (EF) 3-hydroxypalmitic acid methyl ester biosynthesis protein
MMHLASAMSNLVNGNGNGNGHHQSVAAPQPAAKKPATRPLAPAPDVKESYVTFKIADSVELRGTLVRMTRHVIFFELYNPNDQPQLSDILGAFRIVLQEQVVYSGHAIVRNVLDTGTKIICEINLRESCWTGGSFGVASSYDEITVGFKAFLSEWQKLYKVSPEFKVVIADMQTFLHDLQFWSEQIESLMLSLPKEERIAREHAIATQLEPTIVPAIRNFFEHFEDLSNALDEDLRSAHYAFGKRYIHPLLLGSPFVHRTYSKPLGYAGDYEMVNMMFRDPFEGKSLFAKMINLYALQLPPIIAHRNRIEYLVKKIKQESLRLKVCGQNLQVFNLGCGPAHEVQEFLKTEELSNHAYFTLVDFNDETLKHTTQILNDLKLRHGRKVNIKTIKQSVQQILKQSHKQSGHLQFRQYDLIYCAGLFDYLSDQVCKQLMEIFYGMLLPGGLLVATNVDDHPAQNQMECFLEWHLVHRNEEKMRLLIPEKADLQDVSIKRDSTGVNIFLEVRKAQS